MNTWKTWSWIGPYGRRTVIAAALAASFAAQAQTIGIHAASMHFPTEAGQNDVNPGAYVIFDSRVVLGAYYNTIRRASVHLGYAFEAGPFSLTVGAVTGYQERRVTTPCTTACATAGWRTVGIGHGYLTPMLSPGVVLPAVLGVTPRISYLPGFGFSASVVHLSFEFPL